MAKKKSTPRKSKKPAANSQAGFMEALKQFVRTEGVEYLDDPNVTSVGIGYKEENGKPTKELSIQFTVEHKAAPEVLESLGTTELPKSFVIAGKEVPTDVLQRSYEPGYQIVAEAAANPRKTRINPIVPGTSISHISGTAGTLGCIVFDKHNGVPYVLSNWHVLHGPSGRIGDEIVQPGPHDDNRTQLNHAGKLVRSHLGVAGDCAIATIEDRRFNQDILDLNVKVEQLGEPELGDKVIKSGRTTAVTHGIVTRVDVIARLNYGAPTGLQNVGGFEISPDPRFLPANGEISMGGDSGSAWMFKASNGTTSRIMAGLHFAGEGAGDPREHAVACYPRSVFEKLEITPVPPAVVTVTGPVSGYTPNFLSERVELPKLVAANLRDAVKLNGSEVISHYTHFSLALSSSRKFAYWVAWNIDGGNLKRISRTGIPFIRDPRLDASVQVGDELYAGNRLDRGHIARRADLLWGPLEEAKKANVDSFFFTNITPQMDNFNQSSRGGIWGKLEDAVFEDVDVENLRVSVFGGPVFNPTDRRFRNVLIPVEFYKVLAFVENGRLKAKGFLLTQNLAQLEALDLNEFRVFQVTLAEIETRCGLTFPRNLKAADAMPELLARRAEAVEDRPPLDALSDIVW